MSPSGKGSQSTSAGGQGEIHCRGPGQLKAEARPSVKAEAGYGQACGPRKAKVSKAALATSVPV